MITHRTLKHGLEKRTDTALRFNLYYGKKTKTADNIRILKQSMGEHYGEEVSYSVLFAHVIDFYIKNQPKMAQVLNPELHN